MNSRSLDRIKSLRAEVEALRRATGIVDLPMKDGATRPYRGDLLIDSLAAMRNGDAGFWDWLDGVDLEALATSPDHVVAIARPDGPIPDLSEPAGANDPPAPDGPRLEDTPEWKDAERRARIRTAPLNDLTPAERRERLAGGR